MVIGIKIFGVLSVIFALLLLQALVPGYHAGKFGMYDAAYFITSLCWLVFGIGVIRRLSWARIGLIILALIYIVDTLEYPSKLLAAVKHYGKSALIIPISGLSFFILLVVYFTRPSIKQQFYEKKSRRSR